MTKRSYLVLIAAAAALSALALAGCASTPTATDTGTSTQPAQEQPAATQEATAPAKTGTEVTKLVIKDQTVGKGTAAKAGDTVTVNYTGYLTNGTKFDSSVGRAPFSFKLGSGMVIPGWDQGLVGMKVGGKRQLTIPADLGYGAQGTPDGSIPPNSTLVFDVEMLKIQP